MQGVYGAAGSISDWVPVLEKRLGEMLAALMWPGG